MTNDQLSGNPIILGNGRRMDANDHPAAVAGQSPVRVYRYVARGNNGVELGPYGGDSGGNINTTNAYHEPMVSWTTAVSASFIQQGDDLNYGIPVAERSPNRGLAINKYGNRVAFSYAIDSTATPAGVGKVKIYDRDLTNTSVAPSGWSQVGQELVGDAEGDAFGYAMDMNDRGDVLVITALQSQNDATHGYTKAFTLTETNSVSTWQQIGGTIFGSNPGDNPVSVAMDGNGGRFIVGNDGTTMYSVTGTGTARLYHSKDIDPL